MRALGARSVTVLALVLGVALAAWRVGLLREDYRAQLDPWAPFLVGGFAMLCGTLVFRFWSLAERSEYYFRLGERLPWGAEISLLGGPHRTLLVGHAAQVEVIELPPAVQRALYIVVFLGVGAITVSNRAVALLHDTPAAVARSSSELCPEPSAPEVDTRQSQGCKLVIRAFQLGYANSLGSCGPRPAEAKADDVCRKRQRDEPYLHYAWRLLDTRVRGVADTGSGPTLAVRFERQIDHIAALLDATIDSVAMRPRSSHHLFTDLPDPRPTFGDRVDAAIERGCGARLARLSHFPAIENTPTGRSKQLEHVIDQLVFNPAYKPVVAQCGELTIHWGAPPDACTRLVAQPAETLAEHGALQPVREVLAWRRRKAELARLHMRELGAPPPADRIASFQCLMFDGADQPASERDIMLDGDKLHVREARVGGPDASQIKVYKRLAALLAEGFSYGRLTSNESVGARPEDATMVAAFRDPSLLLTKLDLLRDADLFLGNEWLADRPDLLEVYPYHLHLKTFVEIFRRQYKLHRGRL